MSDSLDRSSPDLGFTIVELVVIISILGILAAVAVPRFVGRDAFAARGFFDQATETVRYAQKTSIAWRREVFVCVTATGITAGLDSDCDPPLINPATGAQLRTSSPPSGVTLTGPSFSFAPPTATTAGGRPLPDTQVTITVNSTIAGDPARQIVIQRETGYVHN